MSKKNRISMYGISRIDDDIHRTHAWRVSLRRRGKKLVRNFPDKKYGGKMKALRAAKQHRDELLEKYPPLTRKEFSAARRSNNKSGITGVYKYAKRYMLKDGTERENWYWEAHWPLGRGESESMSFAVDDYGEDMARRLAIRAREQGLKKVRGVFWASERADVVRSKKKQTSRSSKRSTGRAASKVA